jgi:hypothetical protein
MSIECILNVQQNLKIGVVVMNRIISSKMDRLLYTVILTLVVSVLAIAQTQEIVVDGQPQINQKNPAAYRISGTVTMKPDNQPVADTRIEVRGINKPAAGAQLFTSKTFTDEQGHWTIDQVPDGNYLILVDPTVILSPVNTKDGQVNEVRSGMSAKFVAQTREVKMSGTNIDNLVIQVIKGGRIIGKVIMEGGEPIPKNLIILPEQTVKDGRSPIRIAPVEPDGTFILEGVPTGEILLKVVVYGKPKEYYMKTATVNGIDLLRGTLTIEDGSEVKEVHIVFAKVTDK